MTSASASKTLWPEMWGAAPDRAPSHVEWRYGRTPAHVNAEKRAWMAEHQGVCWSDGYGICGGGLGSGMRLVDSASLSCVPDRAFRLRIGWRKSGYIRKRLDVLASDSWCAKAHRARAGDPHSPSRDYCIVASGERQRCRYVLPVIESHLLGGVP